MFIVQEKYEFQYEEETKIIAQTGTLVPSGLGCKDHNESFISAYWRSVQLRLESLT